MKSIYPVILVAIAASCTSKPDYDAQGTFEATEVAVATEATGRILSLDVEQGDSVVAGRPVGLVDTTQLALQREELLRRQAALLSSRPDISAQVAATREQIAGARTDRDRIARLLAEGAATQQQLDNLNTRLTSLEAQLDAQLSQLHNSSSSIDDQARAIEASIAAVDDKLARCVISSPISGTVLTKLAEAGEVAAFGKPLFIVADMDNVYLRAWFTSDRLADLKVGSKVNVEADYGDGNTRTYDGTVTFISPRSEFTPKTIQTPDSRANLVYAVKIAVKNDGYIKIGLSANVYVGNNDK